MENIKIVSFVKDDRGILGEFFSLFMFCSWFCNAEQILEK